MAAKTKPTEQDTNAKPTGAKAQASPKVLEASAKLTAKNQTTIPTSVRTALGLEPMDRIKFQILTDGRVELIKASNQMEEFDPMVLAYLDFIEADIIANPQMLSVLQDDPELRELLKDVELDENLA
jgi:bifunctional DNA-binding transcriptional regulator/antitoxin component of YhaV-PrlF toxin-antitoxin module